MQIAGLQKLSLVDYPDKLACTVFTQGCNFRCGFCHNPELAPTVAANCKADADGVEDFFKFLEERKNFIDGVCITGGEPLLQEDLESFIIRVKETGLLVKLDTNGFLSGRLENIIKEKLVDYIAMDIKGELDSCCDFSFCNKSESEGFDKSFNAEKSQTCLRRQVVISAIWRGAARIKRGISYSEAAGADVDIEKIKQSIKNIMAGEINYEFRTTIVDKLHNREDILHIAEFIRGAKKYCLQKFEIKDKILSRDFLLAKSIMKDEALLLKTECEKFIDEVELRGWE